MEVLSDADLAALRLAAQVMAHRAALAGQERVAMFFERLEAEADAENAARSQRGQDGGREPAGVDPWLIGLLTPTDRAAIRAYLELLADNDGLPAAVRQVARDLRRAERLS